MNNYTLALHPRPDIRHTFLQLLKLAFPMMLGMLINSFYMLVDAFFIAQYISESSFAAVSTVFPLQLCLFAMALMIANGSSILVSESLGSGNQDAVYRIIGSAFLLIILISLSIGVLVVSYDANMLKALNIPEAISVDASIYLNIIAVGMVLMCISSLSCDLLRSYKMMAALLFVIAFGAIANVVFDYLLIESFKLGVSGAAYATLLSQLSSFLIALLFLNNKINIKKIQIWTSEYCRAILLTGSPAFANYLGMGLIVMICNYNISVYAQYDVASMIAAYGIVGRLNTFVILPLMAISMATQTLSAYAFGANEIDKIKETVIAGLYLAFAYLGAIWLMVITSPETLFTLFFDAQNILNLATHIVQPLMLVLPISAITQITIATLQATRRSHIALMISLTKLYLLLIPTVLLLPKWGLFEWLWYSFPAIEIVIVLAIIVSVGFAISKTGSRRLAL